MLYALLALLVVRVAPADRVAWTTRPLPNASFYVAGVYFCTKTRNLAAAVIVNGKVLAPHYARRPKPALIITTTNKPTISYITAVDKNYVYLKGGGKIKVGEVRLLVEGDDTPATHYTFAATDGSKVWVGAAHHLPLRTVAARLGKGVKVMRLDGGSQTYAGTKWHPKLHNALAILR